MTIKKQVTTHEEIEITFPYYTKENHDYRAFTEDKKKELVGLNVYVNSNDASITSIFWRSDVNKGEPITAEEFFCALEEAKDILDKKELMCMNATLRAERKTVMELDGPVTIDTEREQEYQPKSKLYQGMKNGISQGEKLEG